MNIRSCFLLATTILVASACSATGSYGEAQASAKKVPAPTARATLRSAEGEPRGDAVITEAADGLHVRVNGRGLTPGIHAVHIHTVGLCTAPDFTSAGAHWNPTAHQHGKDNPMGPHLGDLPNLQVGTDGTGQIEFVIPTGRIKTGDTPLLDADGAAVVIHAQADDYKTDPAGNAGGRIACGVIGGR